MLDRKLVDIYKLWLIKATNNPDLIRELRAISNHDSAIEDTFCRDLNFVQAACGL